MFFIFYLNSHIKNLSIHSLHSIILIFKAVLSRVELLGALFLFFFNIIIKEICSLFQTIVINESANASLLHSPI